MIKELDYVIGIDNGVTGTIGVISQAGCKLFKPTPTKKELSYTKTKKYITRVDGVALSKLLLPFILLGKTFVYIERPFIHPKMFTATLSSFRALEATLIIIESLQLPYEYVDSKQWQSVMLPKGIKGRVDLKKASLQIGTRLFPKEAEQNKFDDFDGLLIAEWGWRKNKGAL